MASTSAVEVVMPQMGVSVSEGTITRWAKQVGEQIEADETLLEKAFIPQVDDVARTLKELIDY